MKVLQLLLRFLFLQSHDEGTEIISFSSQLQNEHSEIIRTFQRDRCEETWRIEIR